VILNQVFPVGTLVVHTDSGDRGCVIESNRIGIKIRWCDYGLTILHFDSDQLDQIRIAGHVDDDDDDDDSSESRPQAGREPAGREVAP
jgi:hypothetical protein